MQRLIWNSWQHWSSIVLAKLSGKNDFAFAFDSCLEMSLLGAIKQEKVKEVIQSLSVYTSANLLLSQNILLST